jgi:hypothetical protein
MTTAGRCRRRDGMGCREGPRRAHDLIMRVVRYLVDICGCGIAIAMQRYRTEGIVSDRTSLIPSQRIFGQGSAHSSYAASESSETLRADRKQASAPVT